MSDDILDADAIDVLRLKAFKTNKPADREAYHRAVSKWFQDRHAREMRREMALSDHPTVKQTVAEAEALVVERAVALVNDLYEKVCTSHTRTLLRRQVVTQLIALEATIRAEAAAIRKGETT